MNVIEVLQKRKSVRMFLDKDVEQDMINTILSANHALSGANIQPWQVTIDTGKTKQFLQTQIENTFRSAGKGKQVTPIKS